VESFLSEHLAHLQRVLDDANALLSGSLKRLGYAPEREDTDMNDDTVEQLEIKIAFLERAMNELSDVVFKQQREIAALNDGIALLSSRFDTLKGTDPGYTAEQERPPHY
jgi:SlyX protein